MIVNVPLVVAPWTNLDVGTTYSRLTEPAIEEPRQGCGGLAVANHDEVEPVPEVQKTFTNFDDISMGTRCSMGNGSKCCVRVPLP